jgi:ribose/xylose/arabinose/galactoside ABC-type transport system permease subunit
LVSAVVVSPPVGLLAGAALAAATWWKRGPALLGLAAVAVAAAVVAWITVEQVRNDFPPAFEWPERFTEAHRPALLALALVVAHVVAVHLRARRMPPLGDTTDARPEPPV